MSVLMTFSRAVKTLNTLLKKNNPSTFSSTWIYIHAPSSYLYIWKNIRTENNHIDWDRVTCKLSRKFQKRWVRYRRRQTKQYENQDEINLILSKHQNKLYVFIAPVDEKDRKIRERMLISLVRIAQKGNALAQKEIIKWVTFVIDEWIDRHWQISKWKGYTDDIEKQINQCVRCYKYSGTFLGYLFRTLEYAGRGIVRLQKYSLDDLMYDGSKTRIDFVVQEENDNVYTA